MFQCRIIDAIFSKHPPLVDSTVELFFSRIEWLHIQVSKKRKDGEKERARKWGGEENEKKGRYVHVHVMSLVGLVLFACFSLLSINELYRQYYLFFFTRSAMLCYTMLYYTILYYIVHVLL